MKTMIRYFAIAAVCAAMQTPSTYAQLNVPSDGSDGALNITTNTVINLALASYGSWTNNNSTNAGNGVYDPSQWAVVFKYSSVFISNGVTLTFSNHSTHAPVVWLVESNVTIGGHLSLDGQFGTTTSPAELLPTEPGPGGFRGGAYGSGGWGAGYGPGAIGGETASYTGTYGNPQNIPLIGGSGTTGQSSCVTPGSGNSGGGAILIATAANIIIPAGGSITAVGASYVYQGCTYVHTVASSGGAIRLIANQVTGSGQITADRNRLEANSASSQLIISPNTIAVPPGTTPVIWPSTNSPVVTILSVNGLAAPADPLAGVSTSSDVSISTNNPVNISLQSQNFPPDGSVVLRVTPKYANYYTVNATYVSGTFAQSTWQATTTLPNGFCVLQAHATSP